MIFSVLSKQMIENINYYKYVVKDKNHVIISITNTGDALANIEEHNNCKGILRLTFDDLSQEYENLKLFNEKHAEAILEFVNKYKDNIDMIVVHCHAGISRSAGVACALSKILNEDDSVEISKHLCYNRHVYKVLLNKYYTT